MSQSSCSAKDVQVSVVALTDLLPNLWLQALSINNKNLKQCIPCRGDDSRTSVADKYQMLPTQTICSVQRTMKIMTVIVSIIGVKPAKTDLSCTLTSLELRYVFCVALCIFCVFPCILVLYGLFVLWRSLYCLCVYVYWTTATGWLPKCSKIYIISYRPNQGDRHETLVLRNAVLYVTIQFHEITSHVDICWGFSVSEV